MWCPAQRCQSLSAEDYLELEASPVLSGAGPSFPLSPWASRDRRLAEGRRARPQLSAPLGHDHGRPEGFAPRPLTDPLSPAPWALKPLSRVQRPLLKPSTSRPCPPVPAVLGPGPVGGQPAW